MSDFAHSIRSYFAERTFIDSTPHDGAILNINPLTSGGTTGVPAVLKRTGDTHPQCVSEKYFIAVFKQFIEQITGTGIWSSLL